MKQRTVFAPRSTRFSHGTTILSLRKFLIFTLMLCTLAGAVSGCGLTGETDRPPQDSTAAVPNDGEVREPNDYAAYFNGLYAKEGVFSDTYPWSYCFEVVAGDFLPGHTVTLQVTRMYVRDTPCVWVGTSDPSHHSYNHYGEELYPGSNRWNEGFLHTHAGLYFVKDDRRLPVGQVKYDPDGREMADYYIRATEEKTWSAALMSENYVVRKGDTFDDILTFTIPKHLDYDEVWLVFDTANYIMTSTASTMGIVYSREDRFEGPAGTDTTAESASNAAIDTKERSE